jgi:hypothetical protein
MRVISFYLGTGNILSWEADRDSVITTAVSFVRSSVLSLDPDLTFAQFANDLLADQVSDAQLIYLGYDASPDWVRGLNFKVLEGQKIYVAPQGTVQFTQIFVEDSAEAQLKELGLS